MTNKIERQMDEIVTFLDKHPQGLSISKIANIISFSINNKSLQRRLTSLSDNNRAVKKREKNPVLPCHANNKDRAPTFKGQIDAYLQSKQPKKAEISGITTEFETKSVL